MSKSFSFVFKGYNFDLKKGEILFHFSLKGGENIDFTEKISFPPVTNKVSKSFLKSILDNLMLILGISYWKLYCPKEIIIESNFLTREQADFWNTVYTKGLGEFFYKNKIDFRRLIQFPSAKSGTVQNLKKQNSKKRVSFPRRKRSLLGLGGGRDSIVAAELLKSQNIDFDLFMIGTSKIQKEVANAIGKKPIVINRELDSKLFNFNKEKGVYNGHIPISAIYAFLGLMAATFYDYRSSIVANEKSASYGNVEYLGEMINHQWSKSEEFERLFNKYVQDFITPDITYFSPLRNMNELEVTREFVKYPKYFKFFSSCNSNFKIRNLHFARVASRHLRGDQSSDAGSELSIWCGKCAKCLFVFTLLSAVTSKQDVLNIFGKNLFEDKSLLFLFQELVGVRNFKPFECVGTSEEMKEALSKVSEKEEFKNDFLIAYFLKNKG